MVATAREMDTASIKPNSATANASGASNLIVAKVNVGCDSGGRCAGISPTSGMPVPPASFSSSATRLPTTMPISRLGAFGRTFFMTSAETRVATAIATR